MRRLDVLSSLKPCDALHALCGFAVFEEETP